MFSLKLRLSLCLLNFKLWLRSMLHQAFGKSSLGDAGRGDVGGEGFIGLPVQWILSMKMSQFRLKTSLSRVY